MSTNYEETYNFIKMFLDTTLNNNIISIILNFLYFNQVPFNSKELINDEIKINNKITCIKKLTNDRLAIGFFDGNIFILNLLNTHEVTKLHPSNYINPIPDRYDIDNIIHPLHIRSICQLNNNTIIYGIRNNDHFIQWDFENNIKHQIVSNKYIALNSIIILNEDFITYVVKSSPNEKTTLHNANNFEIINIKTNEIKNITQQTFHPIDISVLGNNVLISSHDYDYNYFKDPRIKIDIIDTNHFIDTMHRYIGSDKVFTEYNRYRFLKKSILIKEQMYIVVLLDIFNNYIVKICDFRTRNDFYFDTRTIYESKKSIKSIIMLNDIHLAILVNGIILIYNAFTGEHMQTIKHTDEKFKSIESLDNSAFIAVDDKSNIILFK